MQDHAYTPNYVDTSVTSTNPIPDRPQTEHKIVFPPMTEYRSVGLERFGAGVTES